MLCKVYAVLRAYVPKNPIVRQNFLSKSAEFGFDQYALKLVIDLHSVHAMQGLCGFGAFLHLIWIKT